MPLHARFRASTSLLFFAALAFGVALAALGGGQTALANSTGTLVPTGQGHYSAWTPNSGSSEVDAIDDGTCGTGDGMWITGSYGTPSSSFTLDLSSMPKHALMQGIDVTICYSDSDGVTLPTVTPFIRRSNTDFLGAGIDPTDTAGTVSVTRHWDLSDAEPINGLEIGVKHVGLIGQVKVWAMWAVITWNPAPTPVPPVPPPTVSPSVITLPPGLPTFHLGQAVEWQTDVTVPPGNIHPLRFVQTWDAAVVLSGPASTAMLLGGASLPCTTSNVFQCTFGVGGGTFRFNLRMVVQSATACSSTSDIAVKTDYPPFLQLGEAHSTISLNGGCPTPTPTATASSTSTSIPTATGTSPGSSATATGTSALSTSTPTGTTGSNTSTTTPGGATTTPTPTPTGTPSVSKPYHLRTMQLARDGTN